MTRKRFLSAIAAALAGCQSQSRPSPEKSLPQPSPDDWSVEIVNRQWNDGLGFMLCQLKVTIHQDLPGDFWEVWAARSSGGLGERYWVGRGIGKGSLYQWIIDTGWLPWVTVTASTKDFRSYPDQRSIWNLATEAGIR